jgi:hypothetical protein
MTQKIITYSFKWLQSGSSKSFRQMYLSSGRPFLFFFLEQVVDHFWKLESVQGFYRMVAPLNILHDSRTWFSNGELDIYSAQYDNILSGTIHPNTVKEMYCSVISHYSVLFLAEILQKGRAK